MSTQKELKTEKARLEQRIFDLRDIRKNLPEYAALEQQLRQMRHDYEFKIKPEIVELQNHIRNIEKEVVEMKKKNEVEIPEDIREWWKNYDRGMNFGYGGLKIVWISEDHQWVIITNRGGTTGQGTAMGTGGYYYAPAEHWLAHTRRGRYSDGVGPDGSRSNRYGNVEGRLTKEKKQELIDLIEQYK